MGDTKINLNGVHLPTADGDIRRFTNPEAAAAKSYFNPSRLVIFINGMDNSPRAHAESALALSLLQMCTVIGVYNRTNGKILDLLQCLGDKLQFDGPLNMQANTKVAIHSLLHPNRSREQVLRKELARNPSALKLFDLLRSPEARNAEIFAHSQGNLILSNALQAIEALDGSAALKNRVVHSFGSPAVNWPKSVQRHEYGFTWDPVSWLAGIDKTMSISKVGMPSNSWQPITHSFLEYMDRDPAFVINRFRTGSLGMTFDMDEAGLAQCLVCMGVNMTRVRAVFQRLEAVHQSDVDDVAVAYVERLDKAADREAIRGALRSDSQLVSLLIRVMQNGWTGSDEDEAKAIETLKHL